MNAHDAPREGHTDRDDLAEIIRLQAEALARLSERMGAEPPGPPGDVPRRAEKKSARDLPALRGEREAGLPLLASDPALSEESLPVLNAFKRFLESERRRARRRLLAATVLFLVLLTGVLVGFWSWGRAHYQKLAGELKAEREKSVSLRQATETELGRVAAAARAAESTARDLRQTLTNTVLATRSNLTSELARHDAEVERLKQLVTGLQIENAALANALSNLRKMPSLAPPWAPTDTATGAEGVATTTTAPPALPTEVASTSRPPTGPRVEPQEASLPVTIQPGGSKGPVQFRLPAQP